MAVSPWRSRNGDFMMTSWEKPCWVFTKAYIMVIWWWFIMAYLLVHLWVHFSPTISRLHRPGIFSTSPASAGFFRDFSLAAGWVITKHQKKTSWWAVMKPRIWWFIGWFYGWGINHPWWYDLVVSWRNFWVIPPAATPLIPRQQITMVFIIQKL